MFTMPSIINTISCLALIINALIFTPQLFKTLKTHATSGISLISYGGFLILEVMLVIYALTINNTWVILSALCGVSNISIIFILLLIYQHKNQHSFTVTLSEILDQLPCHIYWKGRNGEYLGSNRGNWQDLNYHSLAELIGKTDYDILSKDDADRVRLIDDEVMRTGCCNIIEERVTTGEEEDIYLSQKIPLLDKNSQVVGLVGISFNVTDKTKEINQQLMILDNIIAMMPGHVFWLNTEGIYQGCNNNFAELIGLKSSQDIVGKRKVDMPGLLMSESFEATNQQVLKQGQSLIREEPWLLPSGKEMIFLVNKVPLRNAENKLVGVVGIAIDITEQKQQQQALRIAKENAEKSDKMKSQFISNMEHDIRTPLAGIYGMLDMLANQESDLEHKTVLQEVAVCSKELMEYCDGILDFSRIESASCPVMNKNFVLYELINSIIMIENTAAKQKGLHLSLNYDHRIPSLLKGDPYRIQRLLINLVSNAIKFTEEGFVKLTVSLEKKLAKREIIIKFTISDSGIGIPDDKKALVYERFNKVIPSNKGLYKGIGLGLTIVKQFITELEGEIHLQSELGKGSSFIIYLPFKIPLVDAIID